MNPSTSTPASPSIDPQVAAAKAYLASQGYQPPAQNGAPSWQSQIKSPYLNSSSGPTAPQDNPAVDTGKNYLGDVAPAASDINDIAKGFSGGAADDGAPEGNIGKAVDNFSKGNIPVGVEDATLGVGSDAVSALFAPLAAPIQTLLSHAGPARSTVPGEEGADSPQAIAARKSISDWAAAHPDIAKTLGDAINVGGAALGSGALDTTVSDAATGVRNAVTDTATTIKNGAQDTATVLKNKVTGTIASKTPDNILSTPEDQVYKLSPSERKLYFDNQKDVIRNAHDTANSAIDQKAADTEAQVKADLQTKSDTLQKQSEDLNRQVAVSSRDEVLDLRPKIQKALGQQSQQYRALVNEELAPYADVAVSHDELAKFIDDKFAADPDKAQAVKSKLGIQETPKGPSTPGSSDMLPSTDFAKTTTIGDIYKKTLNLGQEISTGVKKGGKVFSPDEVMTDNAISTLSDFMKSRGVDLKAARQFWAKYAPIRNQLVSEAKPFLQAPTQTKTFANTITRVAKGTDVNNENFIAATEDLLGQKVGAKTTEALSKLSTNEKQQISADVEAQTKIADANTAKAQARIEADNTKDAAEKALEIKQFKIEQLAARRKYIHKIITTAIGAGMGSRVGGLQGEGVGALVGLAL